MDDLKLTVTSLKFVWQTLCDLIKNNPDKVYRVSIKEWRERRSLDQNSLYWKWLSEIDKQSHLKVDSGNIKGSELWHEVFKKYYCPVKNITNGENSLPVKSTKMLDVGEMTYYLNKIENWCIDRGIILTIPDSSEYSQLMRRMDS